MKLLHIMIRYNNIYAKTLASDVIYLSHNKHYIEDRKKYYQEFQAKNSPDVTV